MRAHHLESAFHGLRTGVAEKSSLQSADLGTLVRQRSLVLVIVEIRAMDQEGGLLPDHFDDARVSVAERVDADAGDEIQIALTIHIVNIRAFSTTQNQRITGVVLEKIISF